MLVSMKDNEANKLLLQLHFTIQASDEARVTLDCSFGVARGSDSKLRVCVVGIALQA